MGSYYSYPFVEPIGYDYETSLEPRTKPPQTHQRHRGLGACPTCCKRTRVKLGIEDRYLKRYNETKRDVILVKRQLDEAIAETELSAHILKVSTEKYAGYTAYGDKATKYVSRTMKEAHNRNNNAILIEEHLRKRLTRKEKAAENLHKIYEVAVKKASEAMQKQVACNNKRTSMQHGI